MKKFSFLLLMMWISVAFAQEQLKFYDDDPLLQELDTEDASGVEEWDIHLVFDFVENFFLHPGDKATGVRAQDINTIDEVPDSSWYTNRKLTSPDQVAKGPDLTNGPQPGQWTIVAAKNDGVTPGFTIRDSNDDLWFIKFDPPGHLAMATGTEVVVTKLFWALGYYVPENHISSLRFENLKIKEGAKFKLPSGKKRAMKISDIEDMLRLAAKNDDGSYRVIASKALPGKPIGGFRFYGTRPDDPNDIIPHEHRRSLRGYGVFAAWLNHVDSKSINSLDILVKEEDKSVVRHNLLDFGATLGSGSVAPHDKWEGYEPLYEGQRAVGVNTIGFGFPVEKWRRVDYYEAPSIGRFPLKNETWDPDLWQPREPNPAFLRSRPDDKFWAARKLMLISDDMIRAAIREGQFNDPKSEEFLTHALIQRRDAIGRKYLTAINPIIDPVLNSNKLSFSNAAVTHHFAASPKIYQVLWSWFDSDTGQTTRIGESSGSSDGIRPPQELSGKPGAILKVEISAGEDAPESWRKPVAIYFRNTGNGWKLIGLIRM